MSVFLPCFIQLLCLGHDSVIFPIEHARWLRTSILSDASRNSCQVCLCWLSIPISSEILWKISPRCDNIDNWQTWRLSYRAAKRREGEKTKTYSNIINIKYYESYLKGTWYKVSQTHEGSPRFFVKGLVTPPGILHQRKSGINSISGLHLSRKWLTLHVISKGKILLVLPPILPETFTSCLTPMKRGSHKVLLLSVCQSVQRLD